MPYIGDIFLLGWFIISCVVCVYACIKHKEKNKYEPLLKDTELTDIKTDI